jgi:hypothetical protein
MYLQKGLIDVRYWNKSLLFVVVFSPVAVSGIIGSVHLSAVLYNDRICDNILKKEYDKKSL